MTTQKTSEQTQRQTSGVEKPGFLKRLFGKLDETMKAKANEQKQSSCCGGDSTDDSKGGKCC